MATRIRYKEVEHGVFQSDDFWPEDNRRLVVKYSPIEQTGYLQDNSLGEEWFPVVQSKSVAAIKKHLKKALTDRGVTFEQEIRQRGENKKKLEEALENKEKQEQQE